MRKIDLHVHTVFSDGNLNFDDLFSLAEKEDIEYISITDHDTIINLQNYSNYEKKYKLNIVPGIEIASKNMGMHLLGYGINNFEYIEKSLKKLKKQNEYQNIKTIEALKIIGVDISFDRLKEILDGKIVTYRDIVNYLIHYGYVTNAFEAYNKYIGKGAIAYFPSKKLLVNEIIDLISISGGISVLAHPFTLNKNTNFEYLIPMLKEMGLSGIESISPKITLEEQNYYIALNNKYNLINTCGSDFHDSKFDKLGIEIENKYLEEFKQKVIVKRRI